MQIKCPYKQSKVSLKKVLIKYNGPLDLVSVLRCFPRRKQKHMLYNDLYMNVTAALFEKKKPVNQLGGAGAHP